VVVDDVVKNEANEAKKMAIRERQEAQLQKAIEEQKAAAAAEAERERQAKLQQQQAELEARRAALMKRPDGMSKLKKD
jgi:vacuolar-type H+-ATPase subunit E/Vma4